MNIWMKNQKSKAFNKNPFLLLFFSFLLLLPNFFSKHLVALHTSKASWDQFDPKLPPKLQSISSLLQYTDSIAKVRNKGQDTLKYANILAEVVRRRFYHGYSHYSLKENWLASFAGATIWQDLSAIVLPNDIMKYPFAACSQQSIVMMECFRLKGINYRKVGFAHHFTLEGRINGQWYFFDTNMEPDFSVIPRKSFTALQRDKALYVIYKQRLDSSGVDYDLAGSYYGKVNERPAPNASLFQSTTKLFSHILWLFPLVFFFANFFKRKSSKNKRKMQHLSIEEVS